MLTLSCKTGRNIWQPGLHWKEGKRVKKEIAPSHPTLSWLSISWALLVFHHCHHVPRPSMMLFFNKNNKTQLVQAQKKTSSFLAASFSQFQKRLRPGFKLIFSNSFGHFRKLQWYCTWNFEIDLLARVLILWSQPWQPSLCTTAMSWWTLDILVPCKWVPRGCCPSIWNSRDFLFGLM